MTIFINEQEIEFTLEGGEKASEIYESLRNFLKESDYLIYSFSINGEQTDPEEITKWGDLNEKDIEKIEVTALTESEYKLTGLLTIAEYVNFLIVSVSNDQLDDLKGFVEDFPSLLRNIRLFLSGEMGSLIHDQFEKAVNQSGLLKGSFDNGFKTEFLKEIGGISELINMAAREIEDPLNELESTFKALETLNPRLADVSVLLQTGKDKEAMEIVISLTELLNRVIRLMSMFEIENMDLDHLNSILSELVEAFNAEDSVLIGDLLEYEITPILEQLSDVARNLKKNEGRN